MGSELNPRKLIENRAKAALEKMKKGNGLPPPVDSVRVAKLAEFNKSPRKFLETAYINDSLNPKDLEFFDLLLRAKQRSR